MSANTKIILASQSPRRKALLQMADIDFSIAVSHAEESYPKELPFSAIPVYISEKKAYAVKNMQPQDTNTLIIASDTVVIADSKVLGKPKNTTEATQMLRLLSGQTHQVITGVTILPPNGGNPIQFHERTEVEFYPLTDAQIAYYIDKYTPLDKAGAYGIQEWIGLIGIKKINGDYYSVMGLPVARILQEIKDYL